MEIHIYRLNPIDAPAVWRVFIANAGTVVYKQSFSINDEFEALRTALAEYERIVKG